MEPITKFDGWYAFLYNTHRATFKHEGVKYTSAAHAYYVLRAKDRLAAERYIMDAPVNVAVACGKQLVPRDDWQEVSESVMLGILRSKFDGPFLGHLLLQIGDPLKHLSSQCDVFFGIHKEVPAAASP